MNVGFWVVRLRLRAAHGSLLLMQGRGRSSRWGQQHRWHRWGHGSHSSSVLPVCIPCSAAGWAQTCRVPPASLPTRVPTPALQPLPAAACMPTVPCCASVPVQLRSMSWSWLGAEVHPVSRHGSTQPPMALALGSAWHSFSEARPGLGGCWGAPRWPGARHCSGLLQGYVGTAVSWFCVRRILC